MPYDLTQHVWYGQDSRTPRSTARNAVAEFLREKLNDAEGPYYAPLGLGQAVTGGGVTRAIITTSQVLASALYNGSGGKNPLVYIVDGDTDEQRIGRRIGDQNYPGTLHLLTFVLDMGVNSDKSTEKTPVADEERESLLADLVTDALREGRAALSTAGIQEVRITPNAEMQMAGRGRNPHTLTMAYPALPGWTP